MIEFPKLFSYGLELDTYLEFVKPPTLVHDLGANNFLFSS